MPNIEDLQRGVEELRLSRTRVVAAGDAERRRIERELHNGPQQRLVALAVELQRARLLAEDAEPELGELLEALTADVRTALGELRELAERVYPPLLDGAALAASLRAALARTPLPVEVEAEPLGRLPETVVADAYLCCLDAVENAAAHAGARARVRSCSCETATPSASRSPTTAWASTSRRRLPEPASRGSPTALPRLAVGSRSSRPPAAGRASPARSRSADEGAASRSPRGRGSRP